MIEETFPGRRFPCDCATSTAKDTYFMRIGGKRRSFRIDGVPLCVRRTTGGVAELWADEELGLAVGQGYLHARDRMTQMALWRLVGQGRICECVQNDAEQLRMDLLFRTLGLAHYAAAEWDQCSNEARQFAEA